MTNGEIIEKAIPLAQKEFEKKEVRVGDLVCHPSQKRVLEVTEIKEGALVAEWEGIREEHPRREWFDPNMCQDIALGMKVGYIFWIEP